ncbi:MAG: hypothetical protein L3K13_06865 [Thermoplasmata archaeon]|nr:hypothetical protein [Thermoplasmata archaeon]
MDESFAPLGPLPGNHRPLGKRATDWLRARPVLCLFLLTPGIPEYLSGSSSLAGVVTAPGAFLLFLLLNAGLYTSGVLLVREATLRWGKGWPTVLLLGAAYGILEEGVALSTLYNPHASVVGGLGFYGHWLGVSWVWSAGVLLVHAVFSVSLPLFLLGVALPETAGRPLVGRRGLLLATVALGADVGLLLAITRFGAGFWMGSPLFAFSFLAIGALVAAAYLVPRCFRRPRIALHLWGAKRLALLGLLLFPVVLIGEAIAGSVGAPPSLLILGLALLYFAYLGLAVAQLSGGGRERERIAFAFGLILPLLVFGALSQLSVPVFLAADLLFLLFFRHLFRRYPGSQVLLPRAVTLALPTA